MAQVTTGIRAALNFPAVYSAFQRMLGASNTWRVIARDHLPLFPGARLLDVGSGPCDILRELPEGIEYVGVDLNPLYVESAIARFGARGKFIVGDVSALKLDDMPGFDIALAVGLLHHLEDNEASTLLAGLRRLVRPGGQVVMVEPCYHPYQSMFERFLMGRDRGQNIRDERGYRELVPPEFRELRSSLIGKVSRIPWSLVVLTAR